MPFRAADAIVDAEVVSEPQSVSSPPRRSGVVYLHSPPIEPQFQASSLDQTGADYPIQQDPFDQVAALSTDKRARAISLFVKVPLFVYVALSPKMPALVRLGAGALAVWEAMQIASQQKEIEQTFQEAYGP